MCEQWCDPYAAGGDTVTVETDHWSFVASRVYVYDAWSGVDEVEPGETLTGRWLKSVSNEGDLQGSKNPIFLAIPSAYLDAVHDDLMGRSNFERLLEDFPEHVYIGSWTYCDELLVKVGDEVPEALWEAFKGLADYPVYDEEDYFRREWEDFQETLDTALRDARNTVDVEDRMDDLIPDDLDATIREAIQERISDMGQWSRGEDVCWDEVADMYREALASHLPEETS